MASTVWVIGIGADGLGSLSHRARTALDAATFLAGGRRHLELAGAVSAENFVITDNVSALIDRLARRGPDERCVVLASGDPLFFGIGRRLSESLRPEALTIEPALSSIQLAFARVGVPWDDAAVASVHGRPLEDTLRPLLGRPKIALLTQDGDSPAAVAAFFLRYGLEDYRAWVAEDLGTANERVSAFAVSELGGRRFAPLNVVLLLRAGGTAEVERTPPGLDDADFAQPSTGPILLTHADVRALVLARFRALPAGPIWDIGAGLGGVSIELARAFPRREVIAVERSDERLSYLRANHQRFGTYNLRIVAGEAPEALAGGLDPAAIFVGGSGGRLRAIVEVIITRLRPGGRLVGNFLTVENLAEALAAFKATAWAVDVTEVQIAPSQALAGLTSFVPQRPVWIVRAARPAPGGDTE